MACAAAGGDTGGALAERWNGTSWAIQRTPGNPAGTPENALAGVLCTSARVCTAAGFRQRLFTVRTLAERHS